MIDELKDHWPIIAQHPWDALWIFAAGVSVGFGAPKLWRWLFHGSSEKPERGAASKLWDKLATRDFRPNNVEAECVRALRLVDHRFLAAYQVYEFLNRAYPLSDVAHSLEQLSSHGWTRTDFHRNPKTPNTIEVAYSLWGPGLEFARKKGFQTADR